MKTISLWWLPLLLALAACQQSATAPTKSGQKIGKPYVIDGRTYYPEYDPTYDKIGEASWYGPGFHGKHTASGEIYNQNDLTAAHPTLPMPSLVRVTNLRSGKSLIVRINDRGPFKRNRIIDLSKKSAQKLGITSLAQVRVQFLREETEEYMASLETTGRKVDMASYNARQIKNRDASIIKSTEPADQIVEATVSRTRAGQVVSDAAPIMSVRSDELNEPAKAEKGDNDQPAKESELSSFEPSSGQSAGSTMAKEVKLVRLEDTFPAQSSDIPLRGKITTADGAFYVQAGSFAAEENAQKLSSRLEGIGIIDVGKVEMGEKTWWRVRLGPFDSHQDAASALDKVHAAGVPDARVVHL